jgi:hypothetical protein
MTTIFDLIQIPRATEAQPCHRCGALVYYAPNPVSGNALAVSVDYDVAPQCRRPTGAMAGRGVAHAVVCSMASVKVDA